MATASTRGWLTAGGQRLRGWSAFRWTHKQLANINRQGSRQPVQQVDGRVEPTAFNIADRGAIHASIDGQVLLADASGAPGLAKIPCDARATIHAGQSINLPPAIPSDISDILCIGGEGSRAMRCFAGLGRILLILAPILAANTASGQEPQPQPDTIAYYEGWWGYEGENACESPGPDNWWSVALGRMERGETGPIFGRGQIQFRLYDTGCDLYDLSFRDNSVEGHAICQTEDGEELTGRFSFMSVPGNRLAITTPIGDYLFERCGKTDASAKHVSKSVPAPDIQPSYAPVPAPMPEEQRTAIGMVYRDFCDPNFGTSYDLSGPMDHTLYEPYRNQLLTKYQSNCSTFFMGEVSRIIALRDVVSLLPPAIGQAQLDTNGAIALGIWLFLAHSPDIGACVGDGDIRRKFAEEFVGADLQPLGTGDSLTPIAEGFAGGLALWTQAREQRRLPVCHVFLTNAYVAIGAKLRTSANYSP